MRRDYEASRRLAGNLPNGESYIVTVGITADVRIRGGGYFSLTGDRYDERRTLVGSGALSDLADSGRPELILADAMHLSDAITGEPMHGIANAVYHRRNGDTAAAARSLRITEEQASRLSPVALRYFGEAQRPRWQEEANQLREIIAGPDDTYDPREPAPPDEDFPPDEVDFPHADTIDSRELIAVLRSDDETFSPEVIEELEEAAGYAPDWEYGEQLIAADHFEAYARQFAEDIGAIEDDASWPACHVDWSAAADALKADYTEVTIDGVDYFIR